MPSVRTGSTPSTYIRRFPEALVTILASGLFKGFFYGLGPIFAAQSGLTPAQIGQFMALSIAVGQFAQFPLGKLSDRFSRVALIGLTAMLLSIAYLPLACLEVPKRVTVSQFVLVSAALFFFVFIYDFTHCGATSLMWN